MGWSLQESDDLVQLRLLTLVCLEVYASGACTKMLEAEELMERALLLRDEARAMFDRATELALEYAKAKAKPVPEEDINW